MLTQFKTLTDLMVAFQDPQTAIDHFTAIRWPEGAVCPYCDCPKTYTLSRKNKFRCSNCTRNFSVTVGTIFEDTKLPLRVWFGAIWLITSHPKGVVSTTLARDLGINQKSAWLVLHRLRPFYLRSVTDGMLDKSQGPSCFLQVVARSAAPRSLSARRPATESDSDGARILAH